MEHASANRLDNVPWYTAPAILLGVPIVLWLLVQVQPEVFWDRFVWKYYWGPIAADAAGHALASERGIVAEPGYNIVNTLTWAALLGTMILATAQILNRFRTPMDTRLVIAATAWVVAGSIWHVIEDTDLFLPPLQYLFITPPIYLLFAAFGILSFVLGQGLMRIERHGGTEHALRQLWLLLMLVVLVYTALWANDWDQITVYANPVWVAAAAAVTHLIVRWRVTKLGRIDPSELVLMLSTGWFLVGFVYVGMFVDEPWRRVGENAMPSAVVLAPVLSAAVTAVVWLVARSGTGVVAQAFRHPVNLLIVFGQTMDGIATAIGLDLAGYTEKHVLSGMVIERFQAFAQDVGWSFGAQYPTFISFAPLKLALALVVVYVMDVQGREDERRNPTLMGIVKFAIIMVGIGPAVRNFLRLGLGV